MPDRSPGSPDRLTIANKSVRRTNIDILMGSRGFGLFQPFLGTFQMSQKRAPRDRTAVVQISLSCICSYAQF